MESNTDFNPEELECAGSKNQNHFLIEPTLLQCGHFICHNCAWNERSYISGTVRCRICCDDKTINMKTNPASVLMDKQIKMNLDKLFNLLQKRCESTMTQFEKVFRDKKESIELQFECLNEEVQIRAESLKIEIDKLCEKICKEFQFQKDEALKQIDATYANGSKIKKNLESFNDLRLIEKTTDNLDTLQNNLNALNATILENEDYAKLIEITPTQRCIDLELLTYINYRNEKNKMVILPEEFKHKILINVSIGSLDFGDLCVFSDNNLLATDYFNQCISLYDKNMKFIKRAKIKIPQYPKRNIEPFGIAINGRDRIYISNIGENKGVLMTDFAFNFLSFAELKHPSGLCFSNNLLYVCDFDEKCIRTYKADLTYVTSFQLDFAPWYIQVINNVACIRHCYEGCITFFEIPKFSMKYRYEGHNGFICTIDSQFYEFYQPTATFYCYNNDGTIFNKKKTKGPWSQLSIYNPVCYFEEKFIIASTALKTFIVP